MDACTAGSVYGESDSRGPVEVVRPSEVYRYGPHASLDYTEGRGRPVDRTMRQDIHLSELLCLAGLRTRDSGLGARGR